MTIGDDSFCGFARDGDFSVELSLMLSSSRACIFGFLYHYFVQLMVKQIATDISACDSIVSEDLQMFYYFVDRRVTTSLPMITYIHFPWVWYILIPSTIHYYNTMYYDALYNTLWYTMVHTTIHDYALWYTTIHYHRLYDALYNALYATLWYTLTHTLWYTCYTLTYTLCTTIHVGFTLAYTF